MALIISSLITSNRGGDPVKFYLTLPDYPTNDTNYYIWRSYDGSGNNLNNPEWGQAGQALLRQSSSDYADGLNTLAVRSPNNPNPRTVSNNVCKETVEVPSTTSLSNMTWLWGQFLDHEIDLTSTNDAEPANLTTPDVKTDPEEDYPGRTIPFNRSSTVLGTGVTTPREQPNTISAYIDGTNVYGYSSARATALRLLNGSGKLKTTLANNGEVLLPYNTFGLNNAQPSGTDPEDFFVAGDIRANENILLTAMHTLFLREHNRLCDVVVAQRPEWTGQDELIYQHARAMVIGMMQQITFNEFLPALFAPGVIPNYPGYNQFLNAGIKTEFSASAYRLGHSMIPSDLQIGTNPATNVELRDGFFTPSYLQTNGADQLLLGAASRIMNEIDGKVVEDLRSFLFGAPTALMLHDLAAINMQRGRDHGLPAYNAMRVAYGLAAKPDFTHFEPSTQAALTALYTDVNSVDPWIGGLAETHVAGSAIGELIQTVLWEQFKRLRDGDRFWFERDPVLTETDKVTIRNTRLSDIIIRNTSVGALATNVFFV